MCDEVMNKIESRRCEKNCDIVSFINYSIISTAFYLTFGIRRPDTRLNGRVRLGYVMPESLKKDSDSAADLTVISSIHSSLIMSYAHNECHNLCHGIKFLGL